MYTCGEEKFGFFLVDQTSSRRGDAFWCGCVSECVCVCRYVVEKGGLQRDAPMLYTINSKVVENMFLFL